MSTVYETIKNEYEVWKKKVTEDADLTAELTDMEGKEDRITDAFYQNLAFGTGGLRGVIGAGTNRMNIYTVERPLRDWQIISTAISQKRSGKLQSAMTAGLRAACLQSGLRRFLRPMGLGYLSIRS